MRTRPVSQKGINKILTHQKKLEKKPTHTFVVAAALIDAAGNILVQKRPNGKPMAGLWEFPGGKVEGGEAPEAALVRELDEELGIGVREMDISPIAFASEPLEDKHLVLLLYICKKWSGSPKNLHALDLIWLPATELSKLPMPPADRPLVQQLVKLL